VGFIAATFLRLNNIGMVERRDAVLAADKGTDIQTTQTRLYDLQRYVSSHMNADMGTVYLEGQYKRDSQARMDAASNDGNPNGNIYKKAQEVCAPRFSGFSQAYLQCTLDELSKFNAAGNPVTSVRLPKVDEYRHSFASPLWSADFAGFSVLICVLIIFVILARMTGLLILRTMLKMQNRD
jgi:hypothetical protein